MGVEIKLPNEYFTFTKQINLFRKLGIPANIHPSLIFSLSRVLSGLTGEDIATVTGVSRQYISLIETGKKFPSAQFMHTLIVWSCDHILSNKEYLFFVLIYLFVRPYMEESAISDLEPDLLYDVEDSIYLSLDPRDDFDLKEHAYFFFGTVIYALSQLFNYNIYLKQTIDSSNDFPITLNKYNFILLSKLAENESIDLTFTYHKSLEITGIPTRIVTTSPMLAWVSGNISTDSLIRFLFTNKQKPFIISDILSNNISNVSNVYFLSLFLFQEIKTTFNHLMVSSDIIAANNSYIIDKSDFVKFKDLEIELISTPVETKNKELNRKRRRKTNTKQNKLEISINDSDSELKTKRSVEL